MKGKTGKRTVEKVGIVKTLKAYENRIMSLPSIWSSRDKYIRATSMG